MTPRIRPDLKVTPAEEQGVKYFDVADPKSGSKMRLYDFEWLIAERLDGNRRFDEVADYARERLGIHPSPADLEVYAQKLAELGFIEEMAPMVPLYGEPDTTPLPVPVPAPAPQINIDAAAEFTDEPTRPRDSMGTAKTMMAIPEPPLKAPEPKPAPPAPAPVTVAEKKQPAPAPAPEPLAAAAPTTTGKVAPISDEAPARSGTGSLVAVILVLLAVAGVVGYMKFFKPESAHVTVALASPREVVRLYDGAGVVKKGDSQALSFGEAGKVTDVVAKGTETKPGMPLATLESYGAIEKQLADVKDRLKYYENKLEASKAKNDEAGMKADEAKVAEKKKLMGELEARAAKVRLVAPGSGTVTDVLVTAGGDAKPGEAAVKLGGKSMTADFKVEGPKPGDVVEVQPAGGGATLSAKVTQAAGGSITVELPEESALKAGDQLRLVKKREQNVIPVPTAAVTQRDGADVVFVLSDGEAHVRKVTVVDKTPTEALVSSGLAAGDSVITSNASDLQDGQKASSQ